MLMQFAYQTFQMSIILLQINFQNQIIQLPKNIPIENETDDDIKKRIG